MKICNKKLVWGNIVGIVLRLIFLISLPVHIFFPPFLRYSSKFIEYETTFDAFVRCSLYVFNHLLLHK
jgi:hypothetical protein